MIDPVYFEVLKDSFWGNFAPTVNGEFTYEIVLYFGKYDNITASIFALIGSVGGLTATYAIFYGMAIALKKILDKNPGYPQARHYISKFAPIMGFIFVMPKVCVIPAFFFGLAKMDYKKFLLIVIFYRAVFYIYTVMTTHPLYQ